VKILIDTLDLKEIKKYSQFGILSGVTTNPTFSKRFGMSDDIDTINQTSEALGGVGEVHVEAFGESSAEIEDNANSISERSEYNNLIFKVPFTESGVEATSKLSKKGFKINLHLIYSVNQALLSETVGATYICPLIGRKDDIGDDGIANIKKIKDCFDSNSVSTKIMGSSVRYPKHIIELYEIGVDIVTVPPKVLEKMFYHPLTTDGFDTFKKDLESL
jgi:transaldolase|tara:strand:- start:504 stop:1157 length:654 start_codon:yes stop_codon:yes gene_type:complete